MEFKKIILSKTMWAAAIVFIVTVLSAVGIDLPLDLIYGICAALGLVGVKHAVEKLREK